MIDSIEIFARGLSARVQRIVSSGSYDTGPIVPRHRVHPTDEDNER